MFAYAKMAEVVAMKYRPKPTNFIVVAKSDSIEVSNTCLGEDLWWSTETTMLMLVDCMSKVP